MVTTIVVLITFLTLFILYPLAVLLVDSAYSKETGLTLDIFKRIFGMYTFRTAITNTLKVGFTVGISPRSSACCLPMWRFMLRFAPNL